VARSGRGLEKVNRTATTIRQIEFELEKAEHGMGLPYDAGRVGQLRGMLREARKRKLLERRRRIWAVKSAARPFRRSTG
jgi:hypothetical protein